MAVKRRADVTPTRKRTPLRLSRVLGLLIAVAMFATYLFYSRPPAPSRVRPATATRGGEIVAALSAEPRSYNPLATTGVPADAAVDRATQALGMLTQAPLVRRRGGTGDLEPWLAERWELAPDARTVTFTLRDRLAWSDGRPLTADDVVFTVGAALANPATAAPLVIGGMPVEATAPDARTVVVRFPAPFGAGATLFADLPVLPRHRLEAAPAWPLTTPPGALAGAGPFIVQARQPGRLTLARNPRYWRTGADGMVLPYLDTLVLAVVDPAAQLEAVQQGVIDLPDVPVPLADARAMRAADDRKLVNLAELGVRLEPDALWFCRPRLARDPRGAYVNQPEFRWAISHALNREAYAERVYGGAAVPAWGPVTSGNGGWFSPNIPRYRYDLNQTLDLLRQLGLRDTTGDQVLDDAQGRAARFTVLTLADAAGQPWAGAIWVRDALAPVGIALDLRPLPERELRARMQTCDADGILAPAGGDLLDPTANAAFWTSTGAAHVWNPNGVAPATQAERDIDTLMQQVTATADQAKRRALFLQVQLRFSNDLPIVTLAAPRLLYAHAPRVVAFTGTVVPPYALWNADSLGVNAPRRPTSGTQGTGAREATAE